MAEENQKVRILIGRIPQCAWEADPLYWENCFSIRRGDEILATRKELRDADGPPNSYSESCKRVAAEFRKILEENGITDYEVVNGRRTSSSTSRELECDRIPAKGEYSFTYDLRHAPGVVRLVKGKSNARTA